ncbi:hypothetical protein GEMRC1_005821 [Eukaryota sp. GEM-RC1]
MEALNFNTALKKLEIWSCFIFLSSTFESMDTYSLSDSFAHYLATSPHCRFHTSVVNCEQFLNIVQALNSNSGLKIVNFSDLRLDLTSLLIVFETLYYLKLRSLVDISPHIIDMERAWFCFLPQSFTKITIKEITFLQCYLEASSFKELTLKNCGFTGDAITALCAILISSVSLTSVDFSCIGLYKSNYRYDSDDEEGPCFTDIPLSDDDFLKVINALQSNSHLNKINLSNNSIGFFNLLIIFELVSTYKLTSNIIVCPHSIDIENGILCFSPEKSTLITANELTLERCRFTTKTIPALCDLIRDNNSLKSVDFSSIEIYVSDLARCYSTNLHDEHLLKLIDAFQSNSDLKQINLSHTSVKLLTILTIFELVSTAKLTPNIQVSPHSFDFFRGSIRYQNLVDNDDLLSLLDALKSNIPIKRVECRGFKSPTLQGLIILFEILSCYESIVDVDIFPHSFDIKNRLFCFTPQKFHQLSAEEVSYLQYLLNCFSIQGLTLKRCRFTVDTIPDLCDLITGSNSLTSVDFSDCNLFDQSSHNSSDRNCSIISALSSNSNLTKINVINNLIGFDDLLKIFELISSDKLTPNIQVSPHLIDFDHGTIRYDNKLHHSELISFLNALQSKVPIKRFDCLGLKSSSSEEFIALFKIVSNNKSVIFVKICPHIIDVQNGVFCFSPLHSTRLNAEGISSIRTLLECFSIKNLTIRKCHFTQEVNTVLCDIIRINQSSLTSVDFSHSRLSNQDFVDLLNSLRFVSSLKTVNLSVNDINFKRLLNIFDLLYLTIQLLVFKFLNNLLILFLVQLLFKI